MVPVFQRFTPLYYLLGSFSIDLTGTGMSLRAPVRWSIVARPAGIRMQDFHLTNHSQVLSAKCGGNCGKCSPLGDMLVEQLHCGKNLNWIELKAMWIYFRTRRHACEFVDDAMICLTSIYNWFKKIGCLSKNLEGWTLSVQGMLVVAYSKQIKWTNQLSKWLAPYLPVFTILYALVISQCKLPFVCGSK
jgi:hypothetical protein